MEKIFTDCGNFASNFSNQFFGFSTITDSRFLRKFALFAFLIAFQLLQLAFDSFGLIVFIAIRRDREIFEANIYADCTIARLNCLLGHCKQD